jgi:hypothetical protein
MAFWLRKTTSIEQCYIIYDQKLLAIVIAIKHW